MRIYGQRLFAFCLWCAAGLAASEAAGQATGELEQVLKELREVETRIERQLIEETERNRGTAGARSAEAPAAAAPEPASRASALRDELGLGVSDEIQALARAKVEARLRLDEAERGIRLSSLLLLGELEAGAGDSADLMTIALIQGRHRATADLAVEQLLEMEQVRVGRGTALQGERGPEAVPDAERATEPGPEPETTGEDESLLVPGLSESEVLGEERGDSELVELRRRHRELSERLSELTAGAEASRPRALRFGEQRAQLNALMNRLARGGALAATGVTVVEAERSGGGDALVPALPSQEDQRDGRQTFWRATRARIHALAEGKVLFAGPFAGYRHLLILDHGDGWTSLYGNMTQCFVRQDDVMSGGSVLGEYQAEAIGNPEPFWVEVRQGAEPSAVESLPGIGEDWSTAIFQDETP